MARVAPRDGESKQGLVVTLVFFILATIGAGVAAYLGFSDKDKLKKDRDEALKKKDEADAERDWFRFQVAVYRAYLGAPAPVEKPKQLKQGEEAPKDGEILIGQKLPEAKRNFDAGTFGTKYDDYKPVKELMSRLANRSKWDASKNLPDQNYEEMLKDRDSKNALLAADVQVATNQKNLALKEKTDAEAAKKKAMDDYTADLGDVKKKFEDARVTYEKQITELTEQLRASGNKNEPIVKELEKKLDDAGAANKALEKKIKDLDSKIAEMQRRLDTSAVATAERESQTLEPRGEVVRVHTSLKRATINIGRNDGLKPGITFTVHSRQPDGKPKRHKKADVQVLSVDARTAEVEISDVVVWDPERKVYEKIDVLSPDNKDPVVRGDLLINPLWNPNAKTHVAIAGYLDFVGTTPTQLAGFLRRLEDQNVVVDAYVDLSDGKTKGPGLTRRTEYILRGAELDGREAGAPRDKETLKLVNDNIKKLLEDARYNGVEVMRPERFLRDTGFQLPRRSSTESE